MDLSHNSSKIYHRQHNPKSTEAKQNTYMPVAPTTGIRVDRIRSEDVIIDHARQIYSLCRKIRNLQDQVSEVIDMVPEAGQANSKNNSSLSTFNIFSHNIKVMQS